MADVYRVTASWTIRANSSEEAVNIIENAVAGHTDAELEDSDAELETPEFSMSSLMAL